jgi:2,3-bisphosphoglycerate-dependent phosphoglycerate mutase
MRSFSLIVLTAAILAFTAHGAEAQAAKTIILVRHAEKADATNADPDLSAEGKQRAERLVQAIKKYKPGAVYSTNFKRTRDTGMPMANRRKLQVQTYDARKPAELIDAIMKSKTKRFLVVGHSNTIPGLANLIGKKDIFKNLDDAEYGVIWIVRIKGGQVKKTEVLQY